MLRDALSLQVDPEPICSLSANTKKAQPIQAVWMEVGGEGAQECAEGQDGSCCFPSPLCSYVQDKAQQPWFWSRRVLFPPWGAPARGRGEAPPRLPVWADALGSFQQVL